MKTRKEEHQKICSNCETYKILKERGLEGWCESFALNELYTRKNRKVHSSTEREGRIVINKFSQDDFRDWCPFYFEHLTLTTNRKGN